MNNFLKNILFFVLCIVFIFLFKKGFENEIDPLWKETETIVNTEKMMLDESEKELQKIYDSIHPNSEKNAIEFISNPFLPTISWDGFNTLFQKVLFEKKVVVLGVAGSGKSSVADRIALLITGNQEQVTKITCVEGLDTEYHNEWIGYYDQNGFQAGKLLKLFEKCKQNPKKSYALLIDDFDKIYRTTFFGAAIWNELGRAEEVNRIRGYNRKITIPENLYMISTAYVGHLSKVPLVSSDYRRLTNNGNPYHFEPSVVILKAYLTENHKKTLTKNQKDSLVNKLYFFSKINQKITKKIGEAAAIGQWTRINNLLKKNDLVEVRNFIQSSILNYTNTEKISEEDYKSINFTIENNGKLKGTSPVKRFFSEMIRLGIFSELTVAILVALISFLGLRTTSRKRKKLLNKFSLDIENTDKKYYSSQISYNDAYGNLLSIKEKVQNLVKNGKLTFGQGNYLVNDIKDSLRTIDFISSLGENNQNLVEFMKMVIADDDIDEEEFVAHMNFLNENKSNIDIKTFNTVKQQIIKLHHKSNLKYGRTKI